MIVAVLVAAAAAGVLLMSRIGHSDPAAATPQTSTDPAHFDLPALIGTGRVRLSDFRGRPVVVNFFASWCTACRGEAPGFRAVRAAAGRAVTFVGVNTQETGDGAAFAREIGISDWPLARDVGGASSSGLLEAIGGAGLPITAFYDAAGRLRQVLVGALSEDTLRAQLRSLYGIHL
ncbi:MAG: TlpA family protein disulfide reductase [Candidatus Dormibacteraeota bacterium]|uniref:TlpA family protein disulfide reductase n=1 Tax=Candidatus Aeolococcus gillhamiae TaxID=3127015 RepID=A0A934K0T3_9BACT|nr:TlpA family protein disulfide reductase [Candidatus Dormibacteraeota bacterium]